MTRLALSAALGAALLAGAALPASAQSGSGSGLSINPEATGNDRSAGVNNGNNRLPGYRRRSYEGRSYERPVQERGYWRRAEPYYGYPY